MFIFRLPGRVHRGQRRGGNLGVVRATRVEAGEARGHGECVGVHPAAQLLEQRADGEGARERRDDRVQGVVQGLGEGEGAGRQGLPAQQNRCVPPTCTVYACSFQIVFSCSNVFVSGRQHRPSVGCSSYGADEV